MSGEHLGCSVLSAGVGSGRGVRQGAGYTVDGASPGRDVASNSPGERLRDIRTQSLLDYTASAGGAASPLSACGAAIRLTPSAARQSGAVWYSRPQDVGEGFDTSFTFEISSPSQVCGVMDDEHTLCRSRGADGLAFVIQGSSPVALGSAGAGLGYDGIDNGIAVELDSYFNYDLLDVFENHISVLSRVRVYCALCMPCCCKLLITDCLTG